AEREQRENDGEPQRYARLAAALVEIGELRRLRKKRLGVVVHASRRLLRRHEPAHVLSDCGDAGVEAARALRELRLRRLAVVAAPGRHPRRVDGPGEGAAGVAERAGILA